MTLRVAELEKDCSGMREEIEKLGQGNTMWKSVWKKFGLKTRSQMRST